MESFKQQESDRHQRKISCTALVIGLVTSLSFVALFFYFSMSELTHHGIIEDFIKCSLALFLISFWVVTNISLIVLPKFIKLKTETKVESLEA